MFEDFGAKEICIAPSPLMTLYSRGRTTGVVCDAGQTRTSIVPIFEGVNCNFAAKELEIGGQHLTNFFYELMLNDGVGNGFGLGKNFLCKSDLENCR
jgi:actin-related protein